MNASPGSGQAPRPREPSTRRNAPAAGRGSAVRPVPLGQCAPHGFGQRADLHDLDARRPGRIATAGARHDGPREPEPCRLAQAAVQPADAAQLAEQPHLPDGDGPARSAAGRAATTRARAPAGGRARAPRPTGRRRGWRRRRATRGPAPRGDPAPRPAARAGSGPRRRRCAAATGAEVGATSAWTSTSMVRDPSSTGATTDPGAGTSCSARNARAGSATSSRPRSRISNTPTSSVEPYRFLAARRSRSPPVRSPSIESTTSTRCSSVFGPASVPSLVTCPTSTTGIPSALASSISRSVDSRTWPTEPGGPSSSSEATVWTESTTSSPGRASRASSVIRPTPVSATTWIASPTAPPVSPRRDARSRTCVVDSSPVA